MAVEVSLAFVLFIGCTTAMGISLPDSEAELNSISRTNSMWTDCCKNFIIHGLHKTCVL